MSRERNAVVGSGEAGGLALRGGSDARNENGLRVTRHVCGVLSIGLGCELVRFRRYTSASAKPHAIDSILMSLIVTWLPIELSLNLK